MKRLQTRFALLMALVLALSLMVGGRLFAADEQLQRAAIFSGGGTITSGGVTLRSVIGGSIAGGVISSSSGAVLCSGFDCGNQGNSSDDGSGNGNDGSGNGSQGKLFLPRVQDAVP
jgi:hypothetical protein